MNFSIAFHPDATAQAPEQWATVRSTIEAAVARGAKVFVGAGNDFFNALSTIPGVVTVGAKAAADPGSGRPAPRRFIENGETDVRADPRLTLVPVAGGYDLNGDGKADFRHPDPVEQAPLFGTSYATPRALAEAIRTGVVPEDTNEADASQETDVTLPDIEL